MDEANSTTKTSGLDKNTTGLLFVLLTLVAGIIAGALVLGLLSTTGAAQVDTVSNDSDLDPVVGESELKTAIDDWRNDTLDTTDLLYVIDNYRDESTIVDVIDDWRNDTIDTTMLLYMIDLWRSGN